MTAESANGAATSLGRRSPLVPTVLALALAVTGAGAIARVEPAAAVDGACTDPSAVTVVIDFHELGGGVHTRCAPAGSTSGLDALGRAGVSYQTAIRSPGFLCRIAGKPANDPCVDPSPAAAYWSYWIATRGGEWCFSNFGAGNRRPPPGSVEGWSFSVNRPASAAAPPGVAPPPASPGTAPAPLAGGDCDPRVAVTPSTAAPTTPTTDVAAAGVPGTTGAAPTASVHPGPTLGQDDPGAPLSATSGSGQDAPDVGTDPPTSTVAPAVDAATTTAAPASPTGSADLADGTDAEEGASISETSEREDRDEMAGAVDLSDNGSNGSGTPTGLFVVLALVAAMTATVLVRRRGIATLADGSGSEQRAGVDVDTGIDTDVDRRD